MSSKLEGLTIDIERVDAVTLDFYNTLVYHKKGTGRGAELMAYLASSGLESDPWEHRVLYDLFERHADDYSPTFDAEQKRDYVESLTARLFELLSVRGSQISVSEHVDEIWRLVGPSSLGVYEDVPHMLQMFRNVGYPTSIISNWQCGLSHFCHELGIAGLVDHIIASAEVEVAKPDSRIFQVACERMKISCDRVLHIGDSTVDDVEGGRAAGMQVLLLQRASGATASDMPVIHSLDELCHMFQIDGEHDWPTDFTQKASEN